MRISGDFAGGAAVGTLPSSAVGAGLIPAQEAKIPRASRPKKKTNVKQKQYCNKDFNNGPHQEKKRISGASPGKTICAAKEILVS